MKKKLISVIIPVYRVEKYLERCLDSVIGNTYQELEVICVNDGSPDGSLKILEKYAAKDQRIIIIDKKNEGVSAARNDGVKAAHGSWISFIDSDDWIHPQFFEILIDLAEKTDADIVIGNHLRAKEFDPPETIDMNQVKYVRADLNMIYRNRNMKSFVWGKLYKADILEGHRFDTQIAYGEDSLFNAEIYCEPKELKIISTDEILYYYNNRENSVVNVIDQEDRARLGENWINMSDQTSNPVMKSICLVEGLKRTLLARYTESYTEKRKETIRHCNAILKDGCSKLLRNKNIKAKDKVIYTLFAYVPQAYRRWRIIDDPTMKEWERNQKNHPERKQR